MRRKWALPPFRADVAGVKVADEKELVKKVVDAVVRKSFDGKARDALLPKGLRDRKRKCADAATPTALPEQRKPLALRVIKAVKRSEAPLLRPRVVMAVADKRRPHPACL